MFESKDVIKSNIHEYLSSLKFWIPIRVDNVLQEGAIRLEEEDPVFFFYQEVKMEIWKIRNKLREAKLPTSFLENLQECFHSAHSIIS